MAAPVIVRRDEIAAQPCYQARPAHAAEATRRDPKQATSAVCYQRVELGPDLGLPMLVESGEVVVPVRSELPQEVAVRSLTEPFVDHVAGIVAECPKDESEIWRQMLIEQDPRYATASSNSMARSI